MFTRRKFLQTLPALSALPTVLHSSGAHAQLIADKPIHMIVGASPGTTIDNTARFLAERLPSFVKVPVVVENRPGAGGALGSSVAARAPADGHTLLFTGITHFAARYSGEAAEIYDPLNDFKAVTRVCAAALALVVPTNSPYQTLDDLLKAMKANPGGIDFASGGVGSSSHLCTAIMMDKTGTKALHIPYKGNAQAVTDTMGGIVAFTCQGSAGVLPMIKGGRLRALVVTSPKRWDSLPDVPTGIELGIPDFQVASWMGAMAPAKTPDATIAVLSDAFTKVARSKEFEDYCAKQTMYIDLMEHAEFQASLPKEDAHWRRVAELIKNN